MLERFRGRVRSANGQFWRSETAVTLALALVVGLGSGLGAVGFRWLIGQAHGAFFVRLPALAPLRAQPYVILLAPALGGLIVGVIGTAVAPEARGPGVANVMEALALHGGRIRPIVIAARPLATAISLGSGGSAGREGPVVHLGSAIGSAVSQLANLSPERTRSLVACGAAGGVAATFNAPLAGVMFAMEVLLAEFSLVQFSSVVVAAVLASVVGHAYFGDVPAFSFPTSSSSATWELPMYALLGVVAAFVGVGFTRVLDQTDAFFERRAFPSFLKPAVGGLVVGIVGLWFPQILGIGYASIEAVLFGRLTVLSIVLLGLLKIAATSLTIGSGGSGGIFGPCLFIGAMLGGLGSRMVQQWTPGGAGVATYVLVGMSAVFAASSRAPIASILTLFEMTRDYNIVLPLMLASVVSAVVARHLLADSIYTYKLSRQGIDVYTSRDLDLMSSILVSEAMTPIEEMTTVTPSTPLAQLARIFDESHYHGTVVVDESCYLQGIVTLSDLERAQSQQLMTGTVGDIHITNVRTVFPDQTLKDALQHFGALDVGRIPVVERGHHPLVVGLLRRGDIVRAYSHALLDHQARLKDLGRTRLVRPAGNDAERAGPRSLAGWEADATGSAVEIRLEARHGAVGSTLEELNLPSHVLIATVRRDGRVLIPRGDTRLEAGDVVVALAPEGEQEALRKRLTQPGRP